MKIVTLKSGREKSLLRKHPWVFSGAISKLSGEPHPGETVEIHDSKDRFVAYGAYSPHSNIRIRIWDWDRQTEIDEDFLRQKMLNAISYRKNLFFPEKPAQAQRLIYAESDGLPGFIVDRYADMLVVQILSAGAEFWRGTFFSLIQELTNAEQIYERSDVDVRKLERLEQRRGVVYGNPTPDLVISESDLQFHVNVLEGHKTGFYLDQSLNRRVVRNLAKDADALDCFCYSGGFTANIIAGGAQSVTAVDASSEALELAKRNLNLNAFAPESVEWHAADVFQQLRKFRDQGKTFDLIILDPPKFAPTRAQVKKAARGYKDINLLALKLLRPGGKLVTFSCSGGVSSDLFQKIVAGAALDAGVNAQISAYLHQSPDHPVALNFPEGAYLKGLILHTGII